MRFFLLLLVSFVALLGVKAECPNACSGHGDCTRYDMCDCNRNWQAADCSERTCQFGLAHVDTPKGDLDMSGGSLTGPGSSVISGSMVYPYGTTEQFPDMADASGTTLLNSAHYYMECSNKGMCNRQDGVCECFEGYEGSACQRASCPNDCSNHGVCKSIFQIAEADNSNTYELWDKYSTMGCYCDPGYFGPDCSLRECKHGVDPLYIDDEANARYSQFTILLDGDSADPEGDFSITFYDVFGEDWETDPITFDSTDSCDVITAALEGLPNDVIPADSVSCTFDLTSYLATIELQFTGNPGYLKEPEINIYLSGSTATFTVDSIIVSSMSGMGEFTDYVSTHCDDVSVSITAGLYAYLTIENTDGGADNTNEIYKIKSCLSTSDYDDDTNQDVNNWDTGSVTWPHLVKFVESGSTDGGFYSLLYYNTTTWNLMHDIPLDDGTELEVFTTDATMQMVFFDEDGDTHYVEGTDSLSVNITASTYGTDTIELSTDASCDTNNTVVSHCLEKGDVIMFSTGNWVFADADIATGEFYTITRVWTDLADVAGTSDKYYITVDHTVNVDFDGGYLYVMTEGDESYDYVTECSNRGYCNRDEGLCECFKGYTNDNCDTQSSLAI